MSLIRYPALWSPFQMRWAYQEKWDLFITFDWAVLLTKIQPIWTQFCTIFSGIPHSTILGGPKYVRQSLYLASLAYLVHVFCQAEYCWVGYPWKGHAKCSSDALNSSQKDCPVKKTKICLLLQRGWVVPNGYFHLWKYPAPLGADVSIWSRIALLQICFVAEGG